VRGSRVDLRIAVRNLSVKGVSQVAERVCRLLVVVVSAAVLGESAFGRLVFASTVTFLLALGTDLGTGVWTTRELAKGRVRAEDVVRVGLSLRAAASLPYCLVVAAIALFAVRGEDSAAMALLGLAALANAFVDHFGAILRGLERFVDEARLNGLRAVATTTAGLGGLFAHRSLAGLCVGLAGASVAGVAYGGLVVWRLNPPVRGRERGRPLDRALAWVALRQSLPIWLAGLVSLLYFKVDTFFLKFLAGDAELGSYGAAYKFFEGSMILPSVLLSVTFPRLSRAHGRPLAQRELERRLGALLLVLGVLAGVVCSGGARPLVHVAFGIGFERAVLPLRVLALGLPFLYVNFGLTHFLLARDRGQATLILAVMMLGLNVALDAALIPRHLGLGAAWATSVSEVALTLGCLADLRWGGRLRPLPSAQGAARTGQKAA
jgi:O-antigen/teichoic acid export membrane protein